MTYMALDLEVNTAKRGKKLDVFNPENYIVLRGWKVEGDERATWERFNSKDEVTALVIPPEVDVICGVNLKYDLHNEMQIPEGRQALLDFAKRGGKFWDCQYAEFLLRGMEPDAMWLSMDDMIESYGGRKKIDGVKELWEAGVQTVDIDPDLLLDYFVGTEEEGRNSGDIGNTELIYVGQHQAMYDLGMERAIPPRMDGYGCTVEMEFNGIHIDIETMRANLKELIAEQDTLAEELSHYITDMPEGLVFNWNSNTHLSCILFGGTIKYKKVSTYIDEKTGELARLKATEKWPLFDGEAVQPSDVCYQLEDGLYRLTNHEQRTTVIQDTYKSGKKVGEGKFKNVAVPGELKTKICEFFHTMPGYIIPRDEWEGKQLDGAGKPIYSTSSDTLDEIEKIHGNNAAPFVKSYLRFAALTKEIGTYYFKVDDKGVASGMLTYIDKHRMVIHHKLNHCAVTTGRLSSSEPNMQNAPRADKSKLKKGFNSRFCEDGVMGEIDYSQLEVVVQGLLSGDVNLCRDLNDKIDFHCKRVALKMTALGNPCTYEEALYRCKDEDFAEYKVWKKERTKCKIFSFQLAYGAGYVTIAVETGMDEDEVKLLMELDNKEYPGIQKFNNAVATECAKTAEPFRDPSKGYRVFRKGHWTAPTGTVYTWTSVDAPAWQKKKGINDTFMPTELKNYPIQGTGAEIVQMILGVLWRWFMKNDNFGGKAFLVNTVHDCVWFDCHKDVVDEVIAGAVKIMSAVPQLLKLFYGMDCPVPFPVEAEVGPNLYDLKHWHAEAA